ncbi:hypothetical protein B8W66_02930 [Mycobacterium decipiens]|uniref:Uncharacterized protein n=1 Tax=Mycobacterium decipiens TaxID=1430326 RepID=A0A1X2LZ67_9MYCO|nr:hypothetical protein [Mycobacterium decipiens]OSC42524.1 hypothetical protein B8W66_02930 [Mycobacterium decipiens]
MIRLLVLVHVPAECPKAEAVREGITEMLGVFPPHLRRTLTWAQGKELSLHQQITADMGCRCSSVTRTRRGSADPMRT